MSEAVVLGDLVKAIGLRGEVKLRESQDFWVEALGSRQLLLEAGDGSRRPVQLEAERVHHPGMRVLRLRGVEDRDAAQALVGSQLVLGTAALDVPVPPSPRPFQLRGLAVVLPDGSSLGRIAEVL